MKLRIVEAGPLGSVSIHLPQRTRLVLVLLAATGLLFGCATPIGIRTADPLEVQRYLTRSALTEPHPSDFSQNELRRYDLLDEYADDPDSALEKLHAAALAEDLPPHALFALAELSFLRAQRTELQAHYAAALVYSYALLFPEQERAPLDELDPRTRIAADLYNRSLTCAFKRTEQGTLALDGSGEIELPFAALSVTRSPDMLEMAGTELYDLQPVAEIEIRGLRNRYRRPGIGAPLAAKTRPLPGVVPVVHVPPQMRIPLTAVVRIDSPLAGLRSGELHGRLELYASLDTESIDLDGRTIPLETEPTAALAATLAASQFWKTELQVFMGNAIGVRRESALFGLHPYEAGRIPVVFVHGTASSAARWSDMVVLGHSQGGLLTKLTAIDSGDAFWSRISDKPLDDLDLSPDDKQLLRDTMFVKPLPFVREVIFLATPQRGSYLAGPQIVRRLAAYFVRLPSEVVKLGVGLATLAPAGGAGLALERLPTSIDNMSPGNDFIQQLARIPVSPEVTAHSIIAVDSDDPLDRAGDGVVKYESAHIEGVESELIVRSPHSGMQAAPATVEEVRRILREHAERSECPSRES